jgi:hypothetical protein
MATALHSHKNSHPLRAGQIADYQRNGFLVVRGFFSVEELQPLRWAYAEDPTINGHVYGMEDIEGRGHPTCTWIELGDDHSKFSIKTSTCLARVDWHQDYASWYDDGLLFPQLLTVGIAVEPATRDNGCVQFIPGSHRMGRIGHPAADGGHGLFEARVERAQQQLGQIHVELDVGDAVFFHCNMLHGSGLNDTDTERVMLFSSYNAVSNPPYMEAIGANEEGAFMGISIEDRAYRPLDKLSDDVLSKRSFRSAFSHTRFNEPDFQLSGTYSKAVKLAK